MPRDRNLNELGDFLKARRSELDPAAAGLVADGQSRRVAGLRREEVAELAGISTDYYTRIEQGRIRASVPVLECVGRVLRLDEEQCEYLLHLAAAGKDRASAPSPEAAQHVRPQLQQMLDDLRLTAGFVIGRRTDLLAWNRLAALLVMDFGRLRETERNYVRLVFTEPSIRTLYRDWEDMARLAVAHLRMDSRRRPDDPRLTALVQELSEHDEQFREWWACHDVAVRSGGTRLLRHPLVGDLAFERSTLTCADDPEQQLVVWTAPPGSTTEQALRLLVDADASRRDAALESEHSAPVHIRT